MIGFKPSLNAGKMTNKILVELKKSLEPYLFFWDEWSHDDNCNLNTHEIALVNGYIACAFEIGMFESFLFYNRARALRDVIRKLNLGYQIFKDFVIVSFLFNIIALAKKKDYRQFLETPVKDLEITADLRNILLSFKAYTLQQLFIIYKVEDFGKPGVFKKIVEFQLLSKEKAMVAHNS